MILDYENRQEINKIYIHDGVFMGFDYDYKKRQIFLSTHQMFLRKEINLTFFNVIYFKMQSCQFWSTGNSILDIHLNEDNVELQQFLMAQKTNAESYINSALDRNINYLPIEFEMNSGDNLLIICEKIEWREKEMSEEDYINYMKRFTV